MAENELDDKCEATTKHGVRCKNKRKYGNLCTVHYLKEVFDNENNDNEINKEIEEENGD